MARTIEGYKNEFNSISNFIEKEKEYLKTGIRLGTWHNPQQRIKEYSTKLNILQTEMINITH
jgi:hypothetical protein